MHIVHLLASPYFSGPAEVVVQLALAQRGLGHDVEVVCDTLRVSSSAEELLVPKLEASRLTSRAPLTLSVKSSLAQLWRDVRALRGLTADVVHSHFSHDHLLARLAGRRPLVRSIHAPRSLRWGMPRADGWTVPYAGLAPRLTGRDVVVLPPLIASHFRPREGARGQRIAMVSTFQPSRRHALGLQAFARVRAMHPGATLELMGDGALAAELQTLARPLGSAVTFHGYLAGEAYAAALRDIDEVWVLGLGNDFGGRAALEARASGVRVVAVDEGALASWADAVVPPEPEAIAAVALTGERRDVQLPSSEATVAQVLELYERARVRAQS
ncbi:MAG: glycosyltransferase [Archangium sp.]|nr:glycosyltransferase [Archangium sp.]